MYSRATTSAMADLCALPAGFFPAALVDISAGSQILFLEMRLLAATGGQRTDGGVETCRGMVLSKISQS